MWISPTVHLYVAPSQPLTEYVDNATEREIKFTNAPYKLFYCHACGRLRAAKELNINVYYDGSYIFCREKEYGRSREFPFEYTTVCAGSAFKGRDLLRATNEFVPALPIR